MKGLTGWLRLFVSKQSRPNWSDQYVRPASKIVLLEVLNMGTLHNMLNILNVPCSYYT